MDRILLIVFGSLSVLGMGFGAFSTWMAMRAARKQKASELVLAAWSIGALIGLTVGGMSLAYFVVPIILHHLGG
jgi:amino acid transporter